MKSNTDRMFTANPPGTASVLKNKKVFIAGAGGLGSNVCTMLVRAGIGSIIAADFDKIEYSNLNRQQFFFDQVGLPKVGALKDNMLRIKPDLEIAAIQDRLSADNLDEYIPENVDVIFECFDKAEAKAMLAQFAACKRPDVPLIAVSGLAGLDNLHEVKVVRGPGNIYIVGDMDNEMNEQNGTISSRVMAVAALQAHVGIRLLLGLEVI
jgi:sulfur carrier protein ThiS adenylyltransferase